MTELTEQECHQLIKQLVLWDKIPNYKLTRLTTQVGDKGMYLYKILREFIKEVKGTQKRCGKQCGMDPEKARKLYTSVVHNCVEMLLQVLETAEEYEKERGSK